MAEFTSEDGLRIFYEGWGEGSARPPVLLHHGFVADGTLNWKYTGIADALVEAGRQVWAIDARGHGQSEKPHDPAFYGEAKMAKDLMRLADEIGAEVYDLGGYSMGAIVSVLVAAQDTRVRRMAIGGVGAWVAERGGVDTDALPTELLAEVLEAEDPPDLSDADPARAGAAGFRLLADQVGSDRLAMAAQARSMHQEKIDLHRITAPSVLVVGADDPLGARPEVLAGAISSCELVVLAGDHLTALVDPGFAPAYVEFLGQN
jgi:pimeloyl-ACP methyl ester carboxylesterase